MDVKRISLRFSAGKAALKDYGMGVEWVKRAKSVLIE